MSEAPRLSPLRSCPRCGLRPCRIGQRLCPACHLAYKRARRATSPPEKETSQETPQQQEPKETPGKETGVVQFPDASPLKRRRPGRQVPVDWPLRFLEFYAQQGVRWRAAKYAGVCHDTVLRAERADPAFARQVEDARQTYLDRHALNLNRLAFKKNNVVASIVALKAGRPQEYIERALTVTASFNADLDAQTGQQLLQAMLANLTPESRRQLGEAAPALPELMPLPSDAGIIPVRPDDSPE